MSANESDVTACESGEPKGGTIQAKGPTPARQVAWRLSSWLALVGLPRSSFYALAPQFKPKTLVIGGRVYVVESPAQFLARIAALREAGAP